MMVRGDGLKMRGDVFKSGSFMQVKAVEVTGVVEQIGTPTIRREGVLCQRGDTGVIEMETPLLGGGKV